MNSALVPSLKSVAIAAAFVAGLAVAVAVLAASRPEEEQFPLGTPEEFLDRVEAALAAQGEVAHVTAETIAVFDGQRQALWSSEAWYAIEHEAVRTKTRRAVESGLDIPYETVVLRIEDDVYSSNPGTTEPAEKSNRFEMPACLDPGPDLLIIGLLCGLGPLDGEWDRIEAEGASEFQGTPARSVAAHLQDGRVLRLHVSPDTYLPLGQQMITPGAGQAYAIETAYRVEGIDEGVLPPDFFLPRGVGYVPDDARWLGILEDPGLGVPVYWPGPAVIRGDDYDAVLVDVLDRRGGGEHQPGHRLTLSYEGNNGHFRLDYWPLGTWEAFRETLGAGFLWASCSEYASLSIPEGEVTILRGYEPEAGPDALATPGAVSPGAQHSMRDFNPFPAGCPSGDYDRFMAVARVGGMVVTINAPYGYCCQEGAPFGVFDTEEALLALAESLRLREPEE